MIAGFRYPDGLDPAVFLFDIDACGLADIVNAGVYDDVIHAAAAWREFAGTSARDAEPVPVHSAADLVPLVHADRGGEIFQGNESDSALNNWFRVDRRVHELAAALRRRGTPLPAETSLYRGINPDPLASTFAAWYTGRHGTPPDTEALSALAYHWIEGRLPATWHAASPHRVRHIRNLIGDWADDPVTKEVLALLPDWIRWQAEQTNLPEHLLTPALAAAEATLDQPEPDLGAPCMP